MKKMEDSQLLAALERAERASIGGDELEDDRVRAIEYFNGEMRDMPVEIEGRSTFVSRDVADTINWIMPSLMRIFASTDEVVAFDPVGPEDIEAAEQETDYCNHIVMSKNPGFEIFYTWFHDCLLEKNGYVVAYWEESEDSVEEVYLGQSIDALTMLLEDKYVTVLEQAETIDPNTGEPYYDVRISRKEKCGKVKIINLPSESVRVSNNHTSVRLWDAPYVQYELEKTISDLREIGYEFDADELKSDRRDSEEDDARDDGEYNDESDESADDSMRIVTVKTAFIRMDYNGDGVAELRRIVRVGKKILANEPADFVPVASLSPHIRPHQHIGMSVADLVMDLQKLKTAMLRGVVDNVGLANNGRYAINQERVNLDDMLVSRPGGVVRTDGDPAGAIMPLSHPFAAHQILGVIEYADTVKENRTGVTRYNQGIDANSLNKTASGISQIMSASQQRTELIARVLAETGIKELMRIVHAISLKHQRKPDVVKLRNRWVAIDPSQWRKRTDMTVSVGLGTGTKESQQESLMMILNAQKQAVQIGVATPQNVYYALKKLAQAAGHKDADKFFTDPSTRKPQPPKPDPMIEKEKISGEFDLKREAMKQQGETQRKAMDIEDGQLRDAAGVLLNTGFGGVV